MAVLKSKRGQSNMQFLENAYELEVYTIAMCRKFPKGLMFLITAEICRLAGSCHNNVKTQTSIITAFFKEENKYVLRHKRRSSHQHGG